MEDLEQEPAPLEFDDTPPAPGDLELVRSFLSLHDHRPGEPDSLAPSPSILTRWLRDRARVPADLRPSEADLRWALGVLEAMRERVLAESGEAASASAVRTLNAAAREAGPELRFADGGGAGFASAATGVRGAVGTLLGIAFLAELDGSWSRFKGCGNPTCRAIFFDRSKNRSGRWCSMRSCGNRAKVRRFRERRATTP
jgi:predicted RNA-binding Zn ribbon-like protein